ncbi:hypothetical protein ACIQ62_06090 [Streptomyces sp. NPDC096319]|uniref:hypothetical protein n=1 Tax=Streptomyces sp. NPDC096319 TaxID=3366084 RepID=UPI00380B8348
MTSQLGADTGVRTPIEDLVRDAERRIHDGTWVPTPGDRTVAQKAAAGLLAAVRAPLSQEALPEVDRLARLREALAALALALAHVHGRLAWFLGAAVTALAPILQWRALPVDDGPHFGAVQPTLQQFTEAEDAVRRLQIILARMATA